MKYYKLTCNNCGTNPTYAILCLVCGEKICYMDTCCKNYGKKKTVYEYIWHNKICGAGDGIYLHLYSGEITMSLVGNFVNSKMSIYLNKFGESLKARSISDEFVLNEDLLQSILSEFKTLAYRKYFKINNGRFLTLDDEEEI